MFYRKDARIPSWGARHLSQRVSKMVSWIQIKIVGLRFIRSRGRVMSGDSAWDKPKPYDLNCAQQGFLDTLLEERKARAGGAPLVTS